MENPRRAVAAMRGMRPLRLAVLAYLLAIAALVAVVGYVVEEWQAAALRRDNALQVSTRHAREMADVVARQMEALIQGVDLSLQQLREAYRHGDAGNFEAAVRVAVAALEDHGIQGVVVTDARGYVAYSSISPQQKGVFLGDREYFTAAARGGDHVVVGTPVRSRLLQSWSFVVARPLYDEGRFAGIVVIGLTPEYFARRLIDPRLSSQDVVVVVHPDGSYLARNQRLEQVLGTKVPGERPFLGAEAPAQGVYRVRAPVDGRSRIYAWQRVPGSAVIVLVGLDEETIFAPIEAENRRGRIQAVAVSALLLVLGGGLAVLLWRTARQQRRLVESESRYRSAFEENSSIKLLLDPDGGRILGANEAAVEFYGHPRETLLAMGVADISCLSAVELDAFMAQAGRQGRRRFGFSQRLASGEIRQVESYSGPIEVEGKPLLFAVIHDVTDRHANEQRLKLAASMFAHTHEGIFYCDPEGRILDINDAFARLTGYPRGEALGRDFRFLDAGRQGRDFYDGVWQTLRVDGNWGGEVWNRNKSGEVFVQLLNLSAITGQDGQVAAYVGIYSDISSLKESERRFEQMAHSDALTGLPNRTLLMDRLNQALRSAARRHELLAVAFLDLDGFKPVNDRYGHQKGDEVLIEVARRLRQCVRAADTVCRLGGDEFVLLLRGLVSAEEAGVILERVRQEIAAAYRIGELAIDGVSASIGFACFPDDAADADGLIAAADDAMYEGKRAGRNVVRRSLK